MSEWCQNDVGTADALKMSRVICQVMWWTGFYSVGDRATEVYPGWMKVRIESRFGWNIGWRVEVSEMVPHGGFGGYGITMVKSFVGKLVGDHGGLVERTSFHDTNGNCSGLQQTKESRNVIIIL